MNRTHRIFALLAVLVFVTASAGTVVLQGATSTSPSTPSAPATPSVSATTPGLAGSLYRPIALTPALKAAVERSLDAASASSFPPVAQAAATGAPSVYAMTPYELLTRAGVGNLVAGLATAIQLTNAASSNLALATNFASWSDYLDAAGTGCLTGGLAATAGAGTAAVVGTEYAVEAGSVATHVTPLTFALSCALGAAAGLVIFQMGFNQAQQGVNYGLIWTNFAQQEYTAYMNYVNLTDSMYASLASGVTWAQVGFDRMADNAALSQLNSSNFNIETDLLQSGVAAELGGMASDFQYQIGNDFDNLPLWLNALTQQGAAFDGYGLIKVGPSGDGIFPMTDLHANFTSGALSNITVGGLTLSGTGVFVWGSLPSTNLYLTCSTQAGSPCGFTVTSVTNSSITESWTLAIGTYARPETFNFNPGVYTMTAATTGSWELLPFASQTVTANSRTLGSFGWEDRYYSTAGAVAESGYNSNGCVYQPVPTGDQVVGSGPSYWDGAITGGAAAIEFDNSGGNCGQGGETIVTPSISIETLASCLPGASCYTTWTQLPVTLGNAEFNASVSGETYWLFLRSIGYTNPLQIPPDCLIPAPWQALPSAVDLGNLSLNESIALYLGWLHAIGNFYGANGALPLTVCHQIQHAWDWMNSTYLFTPGFAQLGGVYLNNGTGPETVTGAPMPSEHLANGATWALPYVQTSGSYVAPSVVGSVNATTSYGNALVTPAIAVTTGETLVAQVEFAGGTFVNLSDSAGNVFHILTRDPSATQGTSSVYVVNVTSVASATDKFYATFSGNPTAQVSLTVLQNSGGVIAVSAWDPWAATNTLTLSLTTASVSDVLIVSDYTGGTKATISTPPTGQTFTTGVYGSSGATSDVMGVPLAAGSGTLGFTWATQTSGDAVAVAVGSAAIAHATNESLIISPTLHTIVIPQNKVWPVPLGNPLFVFYAYRNSSQAWNASGDWSVLNLIEVYGNGTSNGTTDHYTSGMTAGDSLYLTGCETNDTYIVNNGSCTVTIQNWSAWLTTITCTGIICQCELNATACSCLMLGTCAPNGGGTCGAGIFVFGTMVDDIYGALGSLSSIPILGGIACPLAWVIGVVLLVFILIAVIYVVIWAVRSVRSARGG